MTVVIQNKHSTTTTNVPSSLAVGEIAFNHQDRRIFVRGPGGTVEDVIATWVSGGPGTGWDDVVSATGTGSSQGVTITESGLVKQDVLVFVNGQFWRDYTLSGTTVTLTVASGAEIIIFKPSGATGTPAYGLSSYCAGKPGASEAVGGGIAPYAFTLVEANCSSYALVAATGTTTFLIKKNGTQVGTIVYSASGTTGTVDITTAGVSLGDRLTVHAPVTPDATLADIMVLLKA